MQSIIAGQRTICRAQGVDFDPPPPGSRLGIALQTLDLMPINGLRIAGSGMACGWYLWGGESTSDAPDFYEPLCVEHVAARCPLALNFLALPPGWRFLTDGEQIDVWFDSSLLGPRNPVPPSDP